MLTTLVALIAVPAVVLSADHQAMCKVQVGEAFPPLSAKTAAGEPTDLKQIGGAKATIVAIGGGPDWMEATLSADLEGPIQTSYGERGVKSVVLASVAAEGDAITTLSVGEREIAERLGSGRGPRVYVLSPAGEVVWFDLEYTLSTYRELRATLDELTAE